MFVCVCVCVCVCVYICNDVYFNHLDFSNYCKEKILEICAVQIETTDKYIIVICVYRTPSSDFNHLSRLLDTALLSLNKPSTKILICGDFKVEM